MTIQMAANGLTNMYIETLSKLQNKQNANTIAKYINTLRHRQKRASPNPSGRDDVVPIEQIDGFPIDRRKDVSIRKEPQVFSDLSGKKDVGGVGNVGSGKELQGSSDLSDKEDVGGVGNVGSRGGYPWYVRESHQGKE